MEFAAVKELSAALSGHFGDVDDPYRALALLIEEFSAKLPPRSTRCRALAPRPRSKNRVAERHYEEELGDVVLSTFYLANALNVDLEAEMQAKYARLKKQFNLDI